MSVNHDNNSDEAVVLETSQQKLDEEKQATAAKGNKTTDSSGKESTHKSSKIIPKNLDALMYLSILGVGLCLVLFFMAYLEFEKIKVIHDRQVKEAITQDAQRLSALLNQKVLSIQTTLKKLPANKLLNETDGLIEEYYPNGSINNIHIPFENTQIVDNPLQGYAFLSSLDNLFNDKDKDNDVSNLEVIKPGSEHARLTLIRLVTLKQQQFFSVVRFPEDYLNDIFSGLNKNSGNMSIAQGEANRFNLFNENKAIDNPFMSSQKIRQTPWILTYTNKIEELNFQVDLFVLVILYASLALCAFLFTIIVLSRRIKKYMTSRKLRLMQETSLGKNSTLIHEDSLTNLGRQTSVAVVDVTKEDTDNALNNDAKTISENLFTEHGIRGYVNSDLTVKTMYLIGQSIAQELESLSLNKITIGRDNRTSSEQLMNALISGLMSQMDLLDTLKIHNVQESISPIMYLNAVTQTQGNGIFVTGGSATADINGLKIIINNTLYTKSQLQSMCLESAEHDITNKPIASFDPQKAPIVNKTESESIKNYLLSIKRQVLGKNTRLTKKIKIVVDTCHASSIVVAKKLFKEIGCDAVFINGDLDGTFSSLQPNCAKPENLQTLIEAVKNEKAAFGFFINSDATGLGVISAKGEIIWGDRVLMLLAKELLSREPGCKIISDVKSTSSIHDWIVDLKGEPDISPSGYINLKERMAMQSATLAAEFTGHFFSKENGHGYDDAFFTILTILQIASKATKHLNQFFEHIPDKISTPEILISVQPGQLKNIMDKLLVQKDELEAMGVITMDGVRAEYEDGWGLVRASHTSNALSLRFEADNHEALQRIAEKFKEVVLSVVFVKFPF